MLFIVLLSFILHWNYPCDSTVLGHKILAYDSHGHCDTFLVAMPETSLVVQIPQHEIYHYKIMAFSENGFSKAAEIYGARIGMTTSAQATKIILGDSLTMIIDADSISSVEFVFQKGFLGLVLRGSYNYAPVFRLPQ